MTWREMLNRVWLRLKDTEGKIWDSDKIGRFAAEALQDLTVGCEASIKRWRFTLTDGTRTQTLPLDLYEIKSVRVNGQKIFGTDGHELEELDGQFLNSTGTPQWYYLEGQKTIAFYKIPTWTDDLTAFASDLGVMVSVDDDSTYHDFTSEYGTVTDVFDTNSKAMVVGDGEVIQANDEDFVCEITYVYTSKAEDDLFLDKVPDLPEYMHYAVIYRVCELALSAEGQGQDEAGAQFYAQRYQELRSEWFGRSRRFANGQDMIFSQFPAFWGADVDMRQRILAK